MTTANRKPHVPDQQEGPPNSSRWYDVALICVKNGEILPRYEQ
jgi:hypothetical protein